LGTPHDSLFHQLFAEPTNAAALLRAILPRAIAATVQWDTLTECSGLLFAPDLGKHEADLLFEARLRDGRTILFLIEHKSESDSGSVLQLMRYELRIFEKWGLADGETRPLPRVVPIVVHHGERPWRAPTTLADLLSEDPIDVHIPRRAFGFLLDDLANRSEAELLARDLPPAAQLGLLLLQFARTLGPDELELALRRWQGLIRAVAAPPGGPESLQVFHSYILMVTDLTADRLAAAITAILGPAAGDIAMSTADKLIAKGKAEGRVEGRAELLLNLLRKRFGAAAEPFAARVQHASLVELDRWALRILDARTAADVFDAE
jgi:predicted transposase YdaD